MAKKTYNTVTGGIKVDPEVEKSVLSRIHSNGGNAYTPADDERACPPRKPTAVQAATLVSDEVTDIDEVFDELEALVSGLPDD